MARRGAHALGGWIAILVALSTGAGPAAARVQEYQIVRLLSYQTQCALSKLEDRSPPAGPMRFFALCENITFYPDGVDIACTDRDDDRSCRVLTHETSFGQLHLLDPKH